MSFAAENIRDWRGYPVIDVAGAKIGSLEAVYVDTATDEPAFATVQIGLPGRRRLVFVPLDGATVAPRHLRVRWEKKQVRQAPSIDTDGELPVGEEPSVYAHYDLAYSADSGQRRLARR